MNSPAKVIQGDFPFEELSRFDTLQDARNADHADANIWSVAENDNAFCYGPCHHYVNVLYWIVTAETHDGDTYYEEDLSDFMAESDDDLE